MMPASDIGRKAGQFYWDDGMPLDKGFWASGNPDDFREGQQTCVNLNPSSAKLEDYRCSSLTGYVLCRIPLLLAGCFWVLNSSHIFVLTIIMTQINNLEFAQNTFKLFKQQSLEKFKTTRINAHLDHYSLMVVYWEIFFWNT